MREKELSRNSGQYFGTMFETPGPKSEQRQEEKKQENSQGGEGRNNKGTANSKNSTEQNIWREKQRNSICPANKRILEMQETEEQEFEEAKNSRNTPDGDGNPRARGVREYFAKPQDLATYFGKNCLHKINPWSYYQFEKYVTSYSQTSEAHRRELETNFSQVISSGIMTELVKANYSSREHVFKNPGAWRDTIETGVVLSKFHGKLRNDTGGPKVGYLLDNRTQLNELRLKPLMMLLNYMVIPKSQEEFHSHLYFMVLSRFPRGSGLEKFLKTDITCMY
jgi:hypothetical protein